MRRLSHSQVNMWKGCRKQWEFNYLKKIPNKSDMSYAHRGNVVHDTIEYVYTNKIEGYQNIEEIFYKFWNKYNMDSTKLKDKKQESLQMVYNAKLLNVKLTDVEMKIYFEDFVGYLDGVNMESKFFCDWKTSTKGAWNETEYLEQLKTYCWLWYRKFGELPNVAKTFYLKKNSVIEYKPTMTDINNVQESMDKVQEQIKEALETNKFPKCCDDGSKCNFFCPYKDLCFGGNKVNFKLMVKGNKIKIMNNLTPLLQKGLLKNFSYEVQNAFHIKQCSNWDAIVRFYNSTSQTLDLGFKDRLLKVLNEYCEHKKIPFDYEIIDAREELKIYDNVLPDELNNITLREYQQEAVDTFIKNRVGILQIATSGGKTEIALEIIKRLKTKALFVVNRKELLYQTKKRMEAAFGMEVGMIGNGINEPKLITVATIQTLIKNLKSFIPFLNTINFIIVDECHIIASKNFKQLFAKLPNTHYRLGLSATPFRDDGNDMMIESGVGSSLFKLSAKELIDKGYIMLPTIHFYDIPCTSFDDDKYMDDYENNIVNNEIRNTVIKDLSITDYANKKILILTKKVAHGKMLSELIPNSFHLHGSVAKKLREEKYNEFVMEKGKVLIATLSIASEGLNIPDLDVIINAAANKGDVKSIQVLGRVLRKIEGKKEAVYIDFMDEGKHTKKHSRARMSTFKNEGYEIRRKKHSGFIEGKNKKV